MPLVPCFPQEAYLTRATYCMLARLLVRDTMPLSTLPLPLIIAGNGNQNHHSRVPITPGRTDLLRVFLSRNYLSGSEKKKSPQTCTLQPDPIQMDLLAHSAADRTAASRNPVKDLRKAGSSCKKRLLEPRNGPSTESKKAVAKRPCTACPYDGEGELIDPLEQPLSDRSCS